uniref:Uncharacterized protein n=1 Tax=Opuntia streptacantha TaxID=393608 RepID=A0A7C8YIU4_OPUST
MSPTPCVPAQAPSLARRLPARPSLPSSNFTKSAHIVPVANHHSPAQYLDAHLAKLRNNSSAGVEKKRAAQEIAEEQLKNGATQSRVCSGEIVEEQLKKVAQIEEEERIKKVGVRRRRREERNNGAQPQERCRSVRKKKRGGGG